MQSKWWEVIIRDKEGRVSIVNAPTYTKFGAKLFARLRGFVPKGGRIEKVEEKKD